MSPADTSLAKFWSCHGATLEGRSVQRQPDKHLVSQQLLCQQEFLCPQEFSWTRQSARKIVGAILGASVGARACEHESRDDVSPHEAYLHSKHNMPINVDLKELRAQETELAEMSEGDPGNLRLKGLLRLVSKLADELEVHGSATMKRSRNVAVAG